METKPDYKSSTSYQISYFPPDTSKPTMDLSQLVSKPSNELKTYNRVSMHLEHILHNEFDLLVSMSYSSVAKKYLLTC